MTIEEMHIMFRELGQQMGIQTTRAIFSEDIDICINLAIDAKARSIIQSNIGMSFDSKVVRDNTKLSPLNGLYTLYTTGVIEGTDISGKGNRFSPFNLNIDSSNVYLYTGFDCVYSEIDVVRCRIIERESIYDVFDDVCSRPSKRHPVVTIEGNDTNLILNIYTGTNQTFVKPDKLIYSYIRKPATVKYDEDNPINNINCDLPEFLHNDIVMLAIEFYIKSLAGQTRDNQ